MRQTRLTNGNMVAGSQKIEIPTDPYLKAKLMAYHGVSTDYELRTALYRDLLRKQRNERHSSNKY